MRNLKDIPFSIWTFIIVIIGFIFFYFYLLLIEGPYSILLSNSYMSVVMWIDIILTIILLFVVPYGFINRKNWARYFTLAYILYSSFWAVIMIYIRYEIILHYIWLVIYVFLIMYLLLSKTSEYFTGVESIKPHKDGHVFHYGEYTLYSKDVKFRGGRIQKIYFFSRKLPENSMPCDIPENMAVGVNKRTGMPYLKKA